MGATGTCSPRRPFGWDSSRLTDDRAASPPPGAPPSTLFTRKTLHDPAFLRRHDGPDPARSGAAVPRRRHRRAGGYRRAGAGERVGVDDRRLVLLADGPGAPP